MTEPSKPVQYSHLTIPERILLVEEIWDSIGDHSENVPVPSSHLEELHRRLDALDRGDLPPAESWEDVKAWFQSL
jgi:putative addiction module component (TIGR02574 family)